ncbi:hypothetical protein BKA69DRAFT_537658 [Paraphysoderma sedebokerense]|nr:hypothetical protein BKA69DRAFT_537658 [Paraphysoderma sedebokerense]
MTYSSEPSTQSSNARPNPLFTTPTKLSSITKSESTVGQLEDDLDDESSTASSPQVELDEDQVNVQGSDLSHTPSRSLTEQLENIRTISLSDTANGNANTSFVSDLGDISSLSIAEEAFLARLDVSLSAKKRKSSSLNSFASSSTSGNLANFGLNNQTKNGAVENSEETDAVAKDGESEEYVSMVDYNYLKAEVELLRAGFEKLQLVVNELVVGNRDASK